MNDFKDWLTELVRRAAPGGGFAGQPGGAYRPDAAAWAALALNVWNVYPDQVTAARDRLASSQLKDGRVVIEIPQRGEPIDAVKTEFRLLEHIHVQRFLLKWRTKTLSGKKETYGLFTY